VTPAVDGLLIAIPPLVVYLAVGLAGPLAGALCMHYRRVLVADVDGAA
jgi:hypothetical protein